MLGTGCEREGRGANWAVLLRVEGQERRKSGQLQGVVAARASLRGRASGLTVPLQPHSAAHKTP